MAETDHDFSKVIQRISTPLLGLALEQLALAEPGERYRSTLLRAVGYKSEGGRPYHFFDQLTAAGATIPQAESTLSQPHDNRFHTPEYDFTPEFAGVLAEHWKARISRMSEALLALEERFPEIKQSETPEPPTI